jgi:hypothetical protein
VLPTGYDPKTDAVSDCGIGPYRSLFWAQAVAGALAGLALAIALADAKPSIPAPVIVMLVISGIARLLIPAFPTDQNGSRFQTVRGTIHMILAIAIFAAVIIAASKLGSTLEHRPAWHSVSGWLTTLPWVMTGAAVAALVALRGPRLKRIFGLLERLFTCPRLCGSSSSRSNWRASADSGLSRRPRWSRRDSWHARLLPGSRCPTRAAFGRPAPRSS